MISICIPTYNGQQYLEQCLNSAISQTYKDIEIIICDDCSTDNTWDIVNEYATKDSRIKVFRNSKNLGLVGNWNNCIERSRGEWIKFLFQDDYLSLDCIEVMVNAILLNDKLVASTRSLIFEKEVDEESKEYSINETLSFAKLGVSAKKPVYISPQQITAFAANNIRINFIGEPTVVMFKKDVIAEMGRFNADLIQLCDLEYFLKIATNYGVKYIPQPLTFFRAGAHKGSISHANVTKKHYSVLYIDAIILVYQMLNDKYFSNFRKLLSFAKKIRLKTFLSIYVYEAYIIAKGSQGEELNAFNALVSKYPQIEKLEKGSIWVFIARSILRRK